MSDRQNAGVAAIGEAFWRFSLAYYARPGVADALIALQDRARRNVNLVLFALWRGAVAGDRLSAAELAGAAAAMGPLNRDIIGPLRQLRQQLRPTPAPDMQDLRHRIAALELTAERRAQSRLARLARRAGRPAGAAADRYGAAAANLACCLGDETGSPEAEKLRRALAALMRLE